MDTKSKLEHAVTSYDRKQSTKRGHNPYALGHYFAALNEAEAMTIKGTAWKQALEAVFCDRILQVCLSALDK